MEMPSNILRASAIAIALGVATFGVATFSAGCATMDEQTRNSEQK